MNHNLTKTGLSLSQAQSISNLCNQRATEISNTLAGINNATRWFKISSEPYIETPGKLIPDNVVDLLLEKSKLHAAQAFLMTNIKAKDSILKNLTIKKFKHTMGVLNVPTYDSAIELDMVDEQWGWNMLSTTQMSEYLEAESYAAHIGQFIHNNGILDKLRKDLSSMKLLDWIDVKSGEKTPVMVDAHHTPEQLLTIHESLATMHRKYESRVNYFKATVKNSVTVENARISRSNSDSIGKVNMSNETLRAEYETLLNVQEGKIKKERADYEAIRHDEIKEASALRISVDPRFQDTINKYLGDLLPEA